MSLQVGYIEGYIGGIDSGISIIASMSIPIRSHSGIWDAKRFESGATSFSYLMHAFYMHIGFLGAHSGLIIYFKKERKGKPYQLGV